MAGNSKAWHTGVYSVAAIVAAIGSAVAVASYDRNPPKGESAFVTPDFWVGVGIVAVALLGALAMLLYQVFQKDDHASMSRREWKRLRESAPPIADGVELPPVLLGEVQSLLDGRASLIDRANPERAGALPRGHALSDLRHIDQQLALKFTPSVIAQHTMPDFSIELRLHQIHSLTLLCLETTVHGPTQLTRGSQLNLLVPQSLGSFRPCNHQGSLTQPPGAELMPSKENLDFGGGMLNIPAWLWTAPILGDMVARMSYPMYFRYGDPPVDDYPFVLRILQDGQRKEARGVLTIPSAS